MQLTSCCCSPLAGGFLCHRHLAGHRPASWWHQCQFAFSHVDSVDTRVCDQIVCGTECSLDLTRQVTIKYQGSIPNGQNEFFCFFGLRRVTSSQVYYDPSDDSLVRGPFFLGVVNHTFRRPEGAGDED
jgi:hypothetical protein